MDSNKKELLKHIEYQEKELYKYKEEISKSINKIQNYVDNLKSQIIEYADMHGLEELNLYNITPKPKFNAIPIGHLKVPKNLLEHVCVVVDIENTRNNLKRELGLTDVVIDPILEQLKSGQIIKVKDLELKEKVVKK
jgi:transposase